MILGLDLATVLHNHRLLAPFVFIIARILSVVISPIPGFAVDLTGIALFGWKAALVYAEIGVLAGASMCFLIARRFRESILQRLVSLRLVQQWESRLSSREEFWIWVGIRLTGNPAFDYVSYAAGLTNCSFKMFFFSTILGSLPNMLLFFYLGGTVPNHGILYATIAIGILMIVGVMFRRKFGISASHDEHR
jgi:uncharacterized membrane protein YdjX (TVP38/TMEM64 family)